MVFGLHLSCLPSSFGWHRVAIEISHSACKRWYSRSIAVDLCIHQLKYICWCLYWPVWYIIDGSGWCPHCIHLLSHLSPGYLPTVTVSTCHQCLYLASLYQDFYLSICIGDVSSRCFSVLCLFPGLGSSNKKSDPWTRVLVNKMFMPRTKSWFAYTNPEEASPGMYT